MKTDEASRSLLAQILALLPGALVGGRLDINLGSWMNSVAPSIGQKISLQSLPVVLASDQSSTLLKAREDTAAMTWVSNVTGAPGVGAVLADTGALAAGDYDFDILLNGIEASAAGKGMIIEHRNAANAATLQSLGGCPAGNSIEVNLRRYTLALNERIRVISGTVAGAVGSQYITAIGRRLA